jgi:gliding motility-associated-like protein
MNKIFLQKILAVFFYLLSIATMKGQATWTNTGCGPNDPAITKVFIDACYDPEGYNEFVYMKVGAAPWNWSNFVATGSGTGYAGTPNSGPPNNSPMATVFTSNPTIIAQLNAGVGPCPTPVFYPAPNPLPAGANVMVTMSSVGVSGLAPNAISTLCGKGPVYVICGNYTSSNGGQFGFFRNGQPGCTGPTCVRTATFNFGTGCVKSVTYNQATFPDADGAHILEDGTASVSGCYDAPPCTAPPAPTLSPNNIIFCAGQGSLPAGQGFGCSNCGVNNNFYNVFTTPTGGVPVYVGPNFPDGYSISSLPVGATTFYVTQTGFCESPRTPITLTKSAGPTLTTTKIDANCFAGPGTGSATVTPSGSPSPYTYLWSNTPPSTQATATGLTPGNYQVTVTDANGCTKAANVTIGSPPDVAVSVGAATAATCVTPGTSTATGSGGSPGFTYTWSNNTTGATLSTLTPGTYTVTATDTKGCTKTTTATIPANTSIPTAVANAPNQLTCTTTSVSINGNGSSTGGFTYNWSGPGIVSGGNTISPTVNQIGNYTITVTNTADGCTKAATVTVTENKTLPTAVIVTPPKITCSVTSVQLSGTGSSTGGFTYAWTGPGIVSGSTTLNPTVNQIGTYTLVVTNSATGCTKEQTIVVTEDKTPPTVNAGPDKTLNCANNQSTSATATGQAGNTYQWSNGTNGATTTITTPGTYTVTATSSTNGCKATDQIVVTTDLTPPTINPVPTVTLTCSQPTPAVNVTATGNNLQWSWSNGGAGPSATVSSTGTVTITVTDGNNGCKTTTTFNVVEDKTQPTAVIAPPLQLNCATGGSIVLDPTGSSTGSSFNWGWSGPSGLLGNNQGPITITQPGQYTLSIFNLFNGCLKQTNVNVIGDVTPPTGSAGPNQALNCFNNGSVTIGVGGSGNQSYSWSNGSLTNSQTITTAGVYTLTITNLGNACTTVSSVTITDDIVPPVVNPIPPVTVNCYTPNPSLVVASTGANLGYTWSPSGSGANSPITQGGTYAVTVTNNTNGCTSAVSITVPFDKTDPDAVVATPPTLNCYNNSSIILDPTGTSVGSNFNYNWSGPSFSSTNLIPPAVTTAGTYILTVTNVTNGCKKTQSVTITQNNTLPTAIAGNPQTLNCYNNGSVTIGGASSSGPNFTYLWSNGNTNATQNVTTPNTYTITVTNTENGCTKEASVVISEDKTNPTIEAGANLFINCYNATISPAATSGGGSNLSYVWTGPGILSGGTTLTPVINAAGTYNVTVTNVTNGCTATDNVEVTADQVQPTAVATASNGIDCNNPTATVDATGSSNGANFTYSWSGPNNFSNNTINPTVSVGGAYIVTVTNTVNGCKKTATINVLEDKTPPSANAGGTQAVTCSNPTIQLNGTGSVGANFSYSWTTTGGNIVTGSSSLTPTINAAGTYSLTVTNNTTGCTATSQATVNEDKIFPVATATGGGLVTCFSPTLPLGVNVVSGSNLQFQWTATNGGNIVGNPNQQNIVVNKGGTYNVTITNAANGCSVTSIATTTEDKADPIASATVSGSIDCNNTTVNLDGVGSSQGANFAFVWTGPNGYNNSSNLNPSITAGGAYTLSITNTTNGCTATKTIVVSEDKNPPSATIFTPNQLNCNNLNVTINASGNAAFIYTWSASNGGNIVSGATTLSPTVNQAGNYTLNVINPQTGCQASYTTSVGSNIAYPTAIINVHPPLTCSNPNVSISAVGSSVGSNFTYAWTGNPGAVQSGFGTPIIGTSVPGNYNLVITNTANGCSASVSTILLDERVYPVASVNTNNYEITCNNLTAGLSAAGSSVAPGITYQWTTTNGNFTSGTNSFTTNIDKGGTYILVVTNTNNSCSATDDIVISQNKNKPTVNAGPSKQITCTASSVQLQGSGSQGSNFGIQWYAISGNVPSSNGGNTFTPQVAQTGTYFLVVTNNTTGCKDTAQTTVTLDQGVPTVSAGTKKELTCATSSVQLDGTGSSQGSNFTFNWTTTNGNFVSGQNTLTPTVNKAGNYKLEITNTANNCKGTALVEVEDNTKKPIIKVAKPILLNCANNSQVLDAAGSSIGNNFTYNWATTNGNILGAASDITVTIDKAGTYNFKIKNTQNSCEKDTTITINENYNKPIPSAAPTAILTCVAPTQVLDASASTNIQNAKITWKSTVPNSIVSGANTLQPTINEEADYTLYLTDTLSQCKDSIVFKVKKDANIPQANAGLTAELNCVAKSIVLQGTASSSATITYAWTTANGNIVAGATTLKPTIDKPGKYTLKVSDSANQCVKESSVDITQDTVVPTVKFVKPSILNCKNAVMILDASGSSAGKNFKYNWTMPTPLSADTITPLINKPGNYVLTIINVKNKCQATNSVKVEQDIVKPQVTIDLKDTINCRNANIKLKATQTTNSGFYTFEWKTPPNGIVKDGNTFSPTVGVAGIYQLVVTDTVNHCPTTAQVKVEENLKTPIVDAGIGGNITCTTTSINLLATATNGDAKDFIYTWTTPNGNLVGAINGLAAKADVAGKYFFEVENKINGCKAKDSTVVTIDANVPTVQILSNGNLDCNTNVLVLDGAGSTQGTGISFTWTAKNGGNFVKDQNTLTPTINSAGVYILEINNTNNNCKKTTEKTITTDTLKALINVSQDIITCANPTTELSAKIFQANNYTLNWTTATNGIVSTKTDTTAIIVDKKGIYTIKVKNSVNGCETAKNVNVLEDKIIPTTDAGAALEINCQDSIVALQGDKSSKGVDFTYKWTTNNGNILSGDNTLNPKIDKAGSYYLSIFNKGNGCQNKDTVEIKINKTIPTLAFAKPDTLTCKKQQVSLSAKTTTTGAAKLTWSAGTNANIVSSDVSQDNILVNRPGVYNLFILDDKNKCKNTSSVTVYQDTIRPTANAGQNIELNCKSPTIDVQGTATGNNLVYNWTTTNGQIIANANQAKVTVKSAGIYKLLVTNSFNQCTANDEMEVTFLGAPKAIILPPQNLTCVRQSVILDSKGSDTGNNYIYTWSDTNGNSLSTTSTLTVTKPDTYNFSVFNTTNDCEQKLQVTVTQDTIAPFADAGPNFVISCDKGFVVLDGDKSSKGAKYAYDWSGGLIQNGKTTTNPVVTAQAVYSLTVTNIDNGCKATDTVGVLSLKPAILEAIATDPLCNGGKGSIEFKQIVGGTPPFNYAIDGGNKFFTNTKFNNLSPNDYVVKVKDSKGCTDEKVLTINEIEKLKLIIPSVQAVKIGDDIKIQAEFSPTNTPLKSIVWSPDSLLIDKNSLTPTVKDIKKSLYLTLKVINENGCEANAQTTISVDKKIEVYVPTTFSPNGDNINDRFIAFGNPELVVKIKWFRVYDRWGEMLYEAFDLLPNDLSQGWDGTFRNGPVNTGVYVWDLQVVLIDGSEKLLKGDVTLDRK